MTDKELIRAEIERKRASYFGNATTFTIAQKMVLTELLSFIDSLPEEPKKCMYSKDNFTDEDRKVLCDGCEEECEYAQKKEPVSKEIGDYDHKTVMESLHPELKEEPVSEELEKAHIWKPADGDDLPEIDREVIAILDNGKVGFAHRPPEYWDGKNIDTGKVTRHYPKTYDKGGWNIPDVVIWLDLDIPKLRRIEL